MIRRTMNSSRSAWCKIQQGKKELEKPKNHSKNYSKFERMFLMHKMLNFFFFKNRFRTSGIRTHCPTQKTNLCELQNIKIIFKICSTNLKYTRTFSSFQIRFINRCIESWYKCIKRCKMHLPNTLKNSISTFSLECYYFLKTAKFERIHGATLLILFIKIAESNRMQ